MRWCLALVVLSGCDQLFGLVEVSDIIVPDAQLTFPGCADGMREGFVDLNTFTEVAACAGAWSIPGLAAPAACGRAAGNTGREILGVGCAANDLCAIGWHVCSSRLEVLGHLPQGMTCANAGLPASTFFATAQSGPGAGSCGTGTNDFFGCGTYGLVAPAACAPLDRNSDNMCFVLRNPDVGGWQCPDPDSEVTTVSKSDPTAGGGVMCCADAEL